MSIELYDPVGEVYRPETLPQRALGALAGKRVGLVFNQHVSSLAFWNALETEIEATLRPSSMTRVYKANTWAPAPKADAARLLQETDYVLVGVGA